MAFLWPVFLYSLILIPILFGVVLWILRRRKRYVVRFSSLSIIREARPGNALLRRYLPLALFFLGLTVLLIALARPVAITTIPTSDTTIIMAIDASRSMCSTDIPPSRMEAAKSAAREFIKNQKATTQIGIVVFAGFAAITQPPTTDQELLIDAVDQITTARRTAIGSAILKSIDAIAELIKSIPSTSKSQVGPPPAPLPKGAYAPAIIVLLTDGVSNVGPEPLDAAREAADRGIRVYTIGFGTDSNESIPNCGQPNQGGGDPFGFRGGGGPGFGGFRRGIDEDTLKQVSDLTGGRYYAAANAEELKAVFNDLPVNIITRSETMEISALFSALAFVFVILAVYFSSRWSQPLG